MFVAIGPCNTIRSTSTLVIPPKTALTIFAGSVSRVTLASVTLDTDPAKMVSAVFGGITSVLVLLMVLHGPIATNILNVYSAALAALSMGLRLSRTAVALIAGVMG